MLGELCKLRETRTVEDYDLQFEQLLAPSRKTLGLAGGGDFHQRPVGNDSSGS